LSNDELVKCIHDALELLENYRAYGPMVEEGIAAFKKINECIVEPTTEATEEAKTLIAKMERQIGPYRSMVPQVSIALDKLQEWSKEN
jgi:hypothetical protein